MRLHAYIAIVASALLSIAVAECYYPDGKIASGLIPCNATSSVTHCCRKSDVCLSNGLCFSSGLGSIVRRGCTNSAWNSTECPNFCTTEDFRSGDAVMTPCGPYGSFCCGQDSAARACCDAGNNTLIVGGGEAICNNTITIYSTTTANTTPSTTMATTCPNTEALEATLKTKGNAVIALAVVSGCAVLMLAVLGTDWWAKRRQLDQMVLPPALQRDRNRRV